MSQTFRAVRSARPTPKAQPGIGSQRVSTDPDLTKTVPMALQLGWTIAVLYNAPRQVSNDLDQLHSVEELDIRDRVSVEITRLESLVEGLGAPEAYAGRFDAKVAAVSRTWWVEDSGTRRQPPSNAEVPPRLVDLKSALVSLNLTVITQLAKCGVAVEVAYQLGRSLRDTVNPAAHRTSATDEHGTSPPPKLTDTQRIQESLRRDRVSIIQDWLTTLNPQFPKNAAKIVSSSLGRWSDLAEVTLNQNGPGSLRQGPFPWKGTQRREEFANKVAAGLLPQGDVWLSLLVGDQTTTDLLSPEGYVAAGDAALRRTSAIIGKVLWRYKWAFLLILAIVGLILVAAARYLGNAAQVFTSIAAVASALGVTWKGVGSAIPKLASDAEKPIFGLEEVEAMAWSITTLPDATVNMRGIRYLRKAGITPPVPLGRY